MGTMNTPVSHSMLDSFETCPRKHYLTRVSKAVTEPQGEAAAWGNWVHTQFEIALRDGGALPDKIRGWQPIVDRAAALPGEHLIENRLAVTAGLEPATWRDSWVRGIVDFVAVDGDTAYSLDWKTGKKKPASGQLALSAALVMVNFPEVRRVKTGFVWLKDGSVSRDVLTSHQTGAVWQELLPRIRRLELAFERDTWPAKPSGLCNGWCPAGVGHCEHWKPKRN